MKSTQQGFSLLVVLALGIIMATVVLTFFKVVPVYSEYFAIKNVIEELGTSSGRSDEDLRKTFTLRTSTQDIVSVTAKDLLILATPTATGVGVSYRREVPLVANVSLLFNFEYQAGTPVLQTNPK